MLGSYGQHCDPTAHPHIVTICDQWWEGMGEQRSLQKKVVRQETTSETTVSAVVTAVAQERLEKRLETNVLPAREQRSLPEQGCQAEDNLHCQM